MNKNQIYFTIYFLNIFYPLNIFYYFQNYQIFDGFGNRTGNLHVPSPVLYRSCYGHLILFVLIQPYLLCNKQFRWYLLTNTSNLRIFPTTSAIMINRTESNRAATALPMEICSTLMGGASVETLAVSLSSSFPYFIRTTLAITSSTQNVTINTAMSRNTTTDTFAKMRSSILLATWYDVTQGQNPVMKHHRKFLRHPHNFVDQVSSANFFTETN